MADYGINLRVQGTLGISLVTHLVKPVASVVRPVGQSSNTITWSVESSKLQGWNLQRKVDSGDWTDMISPAAADTSAVDSNSSTAGTYHYRIRSFRGNRYSEFSDEVSIIVPAGAPSDLLTSSDFTYLGSFRMPASVNFGGTNISTAFGRVAMAYRGKGGVDRILMTAHNTTPTSNTDAVYEVTVPTLVQLPSTLNTASVYKAWGNVYGTKRSVLNSGSKWTNCLYIDPADWDTLYWGYFQWYSGSESDRAIGKSALNDSTVVATAEASWRVSGFIPYQIGAGLCRIPDAFVTANCPGKPLCCGFGGSWMSTVANSSRGPVFVAIPEPDVGTHADGSSLPSTLLMRHARASSPPPGELGARRDDDYANQVFGICQSGTSATQIVLRNDAYATGGYNGQTVTIYEGPGSGQSATLTWVSGLTYSVSPAFSVAPVAGSSKYELVYGGGGSGGITPSGGVGYWTYGDIYPQSAAWVSGTKQGVLMLGCMATNRQFYGPGGPHYENCQHRMRVYDPDDLADIAAGSVDPWAVDPVSEWDFNLPGKTYPLGRDSVFAEMTPVALDQANRRLYVASRNGWFDGFENHPHVHVYSIAGSN